MSIDNAPLMGDPDWLSALLAIVYLQGWPQSAVTCGTCLKLRNSQGTELCPLSTMKDLYALVRDSDKVITV